MLVDTPTPCHLAHKFWQRTRCSRAGVLDTGSSRRNRNASVRGRLPYMRLRDLAWKFGLCRRWRGGRWVGWWRRGGSSGPELLGMVRSRLGRGWGERLSRGPRWNSGMELFRLETGLFLGSRLGHRRMRWKLKRTARGHVRSDLCWRQRRSQCKWSCGSRAEAQWWRSGLLTMRWSTH